MKDKTSKIKIPPSSKETASQLKMTIGYIKERIKNYIEKQEKKFSRSQKLIFLWTLIALYALCLIFATYDAFVNNRSDQNKLGDIHPEMKLQQKQKQKEKYEKKSQDTLKLDTIESD